MLKDAMGSIVKTTLKILAALVLLVLIVNIFSFFAVIEPGKRGILMQLGTVKEVYEPGLHFQIPLITNVVVMDVQTQKSQDTVDAASKDLQQIEATVALNYHVDPANVDKLYQQVGLEFSTRVIDPAIQESVKEVTAKYTAEELIAKRAEVKVEIFKSLDARLKNYFIMTDDVSIVNFNFSKEFNDSIEAKQTAVQNALKAENDLKRIQIEAQQRIETAKADAESIRIQGEALKENAGLVQLKMVEKWNGQLPYYSATGANGQIIQLPEVK
jgi:regulator of protease activity HflC (stomatin/prohibitin superfamily)